MDRDLVIFDVCDTLYAENTTVGFLRHFHGRGRYRRREWMVTSKLSPVFYLAAAAQRWLQRDVARAWLVRSLNGARRAELEAKASRYVAETLPAKINHALHARLAEHKAAGHRIVLVSSSLDVVIAALAAALGAEWRASRLGFAGDRCTGRLVEDLTGRKRDVVAALAAEGGGPLHVYTDNLTDLDLVRTADRAHVVVPAGRSRARWGGVDAAFIDL